MRVHTAREIGLLVKGARRERGWSQERLANAIGATRQWVRMLESGKPRLELGLTLRALTALGIAIDVVLPDTSTAPPSEPRPQAVAANLSATRAVHHAPQHRRSSPRRG